MLISLNIKDYSFCAFSEVSGRLLECAAKKRLPENAKTVITFLFPYKTVASAPENISRYAAVPDYHTVCGKILDRAAKKLCETFPEYKFECFLDNSPIPEVFAASVSGLGLVGDNGLLISRYYGSFVFIGEIVTDLELPCYSEYMECHHCGACKTACPVGQKKENCISAITQKKGELSPEETALVKRGGSAWGCDLCAEACPFNKYARNTYIEDFTLGYRERYTPGERTENRPYMWRGENPIRRNTEILGR